jgi:NitT/TauT family transport system substrate-binding protein
MTDQSEFIIRALPVPPAIMLAHVAQNPEVTDAFGQVDFAVWPNTDAMKTDLAEGKVDLCVIPTNTATGLFNQGRLIRLLGVTLWGILHVLTNTPDCRTWPDLKGRRIAIPFKGNMPDTIFRILAEKNGFQPDRDFDLTYQPNHVAARNALLQGDADAVCLPEPVASSTLFEAQRQNKEISRMLNLQQEWARAFAGPPRYAQAGPIISARIADQRPDAIPILKTAIETALAFMKDKPNDAGLLGEPLLGGLPADVIAEALQMVEHRAGWFPETRDDVNDFLQKLMDVSSDLVYGGVPVEDFFV